MQFTLPVDGRATRILSKGAQHLYILNASYYGQSLSKKTIERLYDNFRNLLLHNAALAVDYGLVTWPNCSEAFPVCNGQQFVNVDTFLTISKSAVDQFLKTAPSRVPNSRQCNNILKKN